MLLHLSYFKNTNRYTTDYVISSKIYGSSTFFIIKN